MTTTSRGKPTVLPSVRSPLDETTWPQPGTGVLRIIVEGGLRDGDAVRLAAYARHYSETVICIGHHPETAYDLGFLARFPGLAGFEIYDEEFDRFDELDQLPAVLRSLTLGQTRSSKLSLRRLERFSQLESLYLEGHGKDLESLASLGRLRELTLHSISAPNLAVLEELPALDWLALKEGRFEAFDALGRLRQIRYLELWRVGGLEKLDFVGTLSALQFLFLQSLSKVKRLPSFASLASLHRAHLESLKAVRDLRPLAAAPSLEELVLVDMKQLTHEALLPFRDHPHLRAATLGLGSRKKNEAAEKLLGLPKCGPGTEFVFR